MTFEQWKESVKFGTETNALSEEEQATASDVVTALANRIPPFPFKVAKALDPTIYRNVEYDIWNEAEKERIRNEQLVVPDLEPGVKCLLTFRKWKPDEGPITVFIEKLGEMCTVPYSSVQALPLPAHKVLTWRQGLQYKLQSSFYQSALLSSLPDIQKSHRRLARKGKGKDLSLWLPTLVTGARMPMDFSLPRPSDVTCTSPHALRGNDLLAVDKRFGVPPAPLLPPGSPSQFPQPIMYQEKQRFESHTVFDFKPQIGMPFSYSQPQVTQDMPPKNDDTSVANPGIQMQLPAAQHVEAPYYGNFTTTVFDSSILSQPAQTEQGLLSTPPPSSYDYVSAPSYTYGAPSPDLVCSTPHNGILSPGVTPNICASDATLAYGQEVVAVQQPQQQPQQLVTSYSPVPFTGMVFSCEHPAPTVNLAAQRSNDPEGRDLPAGTYIPTLRFFYNIGYDYFRTYGTALQPCVFPSVQGYNGNFSLTILPYVTDTSIVMPDVRCSVSEAAATTNNFSEDDNSPSASSPGFVVMQPQN
ncbi:hypothetical protein MRX96_022814 [Rhipicephalus microplus]